eukprot:545618-Pyramimonas_sp.AAC.1
MTNVDNVYRGKSAAKVEGRGGGVPVRGLLHRSVVMTVTVTVYVRQNVHSTTRVYKRKVKVPHCSTHYTSACTRFQTRVECPLLYNHPGFLVQSAISCLSQICFSFAVPNSITPVLPTSATQVTACGDAAQREYLSPSWLLCEFYHAQLFYYHVPLVHRLLIPCTLAVSSAPVRVTHPCCWFLIFVGWYVSCSVGTLSGFYLWQEPMEKYWKEKAKQGAESSPGETDSRKSS